MLWGIITPLTIYGVWPVLLTAPLCGNHNQFNLLFSTLLWCLHDKMMNLKIYNTYTTWAQPKTKSFSRGSLGIAR